MRRRAPLATADGPASAGGRASANAATPSSRRHSRREHLKLVTPVSVKGCGGDLDAPTCYHRVTGMNVSHLTGYGAFSLL